MATTADLLLDALGRVRENVHAVLEETPQDRLGTPPADGANTIAWLVWHLTRVLDGSLAEVLSYESVWTSGWYERMALPLPEEAHGSGMSFDEVLLVQASAEHLKGYFDDAYDVATEHLRGLRDEDLDRVVDEDWDPPVTLAVRLVSVVDDCVQHAGQAAYASGILTR
jgi:hypothetical protein